MVAFAPRTHPAATLEARTPPQASTARPTRFAIHRAALTVEMKMPHSLPGSALALGPPSQCRSRERVRISGLDGHAGARSLEVPRPARAPAPAPAPRRHPRSENTPQASTARPTRFAIHSSALTVEMKMPHSLPGSALTLGPPSQCRSREKVRISGFGGHAGAGSLAVPRPAPTARARTCSPQPHPRPTRTRAAPAWDPSGRILCGSSNAVMTNSPPRQRGLTRTRTKPRPSAREVSALPITAPNARAGSVTRRQ